MSFVEPIRNMKNCRVNRSLHGRSVSDSTDMPGHNVFKGYETWAQNGHRGVGEAVDLFGDGGEEVFAIGDAVQTRHRNDVTRKEYIFLEGEGWLAVYAHIDARFESQNHSVSKGEVVGVLRSDLNDPHLHFELWMGGRAVSGNSADNIRDTMLVKMGLAGPRLIVAKKTDNPNDLDGFVYKEVASRWIEERSVIEVNTAALADWLNVSRGGLAPMVPVREAFEQMGFRIGQDVTFDLKHLQAADPRVYAFVLKM